MKLAIATLLACSLLPGAALAQAKKADNRSIEGCVSRIDYGFEDRGMLRVSVTLAREGTPFRLTPEGFVHSSGAGPNLTPAQVAQWAPVLDVLRDSGRSKFEVRFDLDGRKVEYIRGLYYKAC